MYCADERFSQAYQQIREKKRQKFLHRFLYVGRLVPEKATLMLYNAFKELVNEGYHEWKLEFIGTGPEAEYIKANENIDIRGFIAPEELPPLAAEGGCMILPSIHEPWGVSIHEFAAAGLPIIASDVVGAATAFVRNEYNGFVFQSGDTNALKSALKNMMNSTDQELFQMGKRSHELSLQITSESWAATFMSVVHSS